MRYFMLIAGLLVTTVGCFSPRFECSRTVRETIEPAQLQSIDLSTYNGSVTVDPHDAATIEMEVTFKAYGATEAAAKENCESLNYVVTEDNGRLTIEANKPSLQWSASAAFILKVPANCPLALKTSNGAVTVKDISAKVDVNTSNGTVRCEGLRGALAAETSNGAIDVQDSECDIRLKTSNGRISYSGRLIGDQNEIRTSNGRVTLAVPKGESIEVLAKTSNGKINCSLPTRDVVAQSKHSLHVTVGDADGAAATRKISLRTSNGSVSLVPWPSAGGDAE